jgi:hypothetical protein
MVSVSRFLTGHQSCRGTLVLHPEKTKLVYCKDTNRKRDHGVIQFDFLGYTFRPRLAKWKGGLFGVSYLGECQGSCRLNSVTIPPIDDAAVLAA